MSISETIQDRKSQVPPGSVPAGESQMAGIVGELTGLMARAIEGSAGLHQFERELLDRLLRIGGVLLDRFLEAQGDGDRGETLSSSVGCVQRSETHRHVVVRNTETHHHTIGWRRPSRPGTHCGNIAVK